MTYALYAPYKARSETNVPQPINHHMSISSFMIDERTAPANISFEMSSKYLLIRSYISFLSFLVNTFAMCCFF